MPRRPVPPLGQDEFRLFAADEIEDSQKINQDQLNDAKLFTSREEYAKNFKKEIILMLAKDRMIDNIIINKSDRIIIKIIKILIIKAGSIAFKEVQGLPFPAKSIFITLNIVNTTTPGNKKFKTAVLSLNFKPYSPVIIHSENK